MPVSMHKNSDIRPYWTSDCGRAVVYLGDNMQVMLHMGDAQFHAVVTDPPYGLEFMGKEWDAPWKNNGNGAIVNDPAKERGGFQDGSGGNAYSRSRVEYGRDSKVFQQWFFDRATQMLRVSKPGAHLLSFGGTRMFHRMACAVEDAGWEIRDCLMWLYGSGFPKSMDVSKQIDAMHGAKRTPIGTSTSGLGSGQFTQAEGVDGGYGFKSEYEVTAPATDDAKRWDGWGTALKPAWEPVVLARRVMDGNTAECVLEHGTGALNIDACRVGDSGGTGSRGEPSRLNAVYGDGMGGQEIVDTGKGRWPANVLTDGSDAQLCRYFYSAKADATDRPHGKGGYNGYETVVIEYPTNGGDSWSRGVETISLEVSTETSPPKVTDVLRSEVEREWSMMLFGNGTMAQFLKDTKSTTRTKTSSTTNLKTLSWLMHSLTNASIPVVNSETESGGSRAASAKRCNKFQLVITLGRTASLPGAKSVPSGTQLGISVSANRTTSHPTVKPQELCRWLVCMVCPRGGVVLDPFMGSGSTGVAAIHEGMSFVGIEQSQEYADIAVGRLKLALESAPDRVDLVTRTVVPVSKDVPPPAKKLKLR